MIRYALWLCYNGKDFFGFQTQPHHTSVQKTLEDALQRILQESIKIIPSGRTDTGVHALKQIIHFDVSTEKALHRLKTQDIAYKLNALLPDSIRVLKLKRVPATFHARNQVQKKTYVYHILLAPQNNPFIKDYVWYIKHDLDISAMKKAARHLTGKHDFSAFCASDSNAKSKIKELYKISFSQKHMAPTLSLTGEQILSLKFEGRGFLKQMIRIMVGSLVAVGQKKIKADAIKLILKSCDRTKAPMTAPPQGLFLKNVTY